MRALTPLVLALMVVWGCDAPNPSSTLDDIDSLDTESSSSEADVFSDSELENDAIRWIDSGSFPEVPDPWLAPFASEVISFTPGEGAGFGEDDFPEVVLGAPGPGTELQPSLDVLTLGTGGEIVLGFGGRIIVDGPGPDFSIHENPFWPGGSSTNVFAEFGEVSVSDDGEEWWTYPCSPVLGELDTYEGCAGWNPTQPFTAEEGIFLDPADTGGDLFDLAVIGVPSIRFIRIKDLSEGGPPPTAGFDLDGISMLYWDYDASVSETD